LRDGEEEALLKHADLNLHARIVATLKPGCGEVNC
jgi:hypothetical protein